MTSDQVWDPSYSDNEIDPTDPSFYENTPDLLQRLPHVDYDVHGEYIHAFHADVPVSDTAPSNADVPVSGTIPDNVPAPVDLPIYAVKIDTFML